MFTGIIEAMGLVEDITASGSNVSFRIQSAFTPELGVDDSVAHDGVCLTIESIVGNTYQVTAIDETLRRTTLGQWQRGTLVNLERPLRMNGRLDGHMVQGHVDATANCIRVEEKQGSWIIHFQLTEPHGGLIVEKGSICINGVSLTVVDAGTDSFSVAIIPFTWEHTNFHRLHVGDKVNIEFDVIGKYVKAQTLPQTII
ncbi:MAG: riboflavin synthase [Flavobacteriales bacterium]|nr:riboflavin synthase [Flavobacteriales bacterium]